MRTQASLEFLLILAAVSGLCVTAVTVYGRSVGSQERMLRYVANSAISQNYTASSNTVVAQSPALIASMPTDTTVGKESRMQLTFYNCSEGTASVSASSDSLAVYPANETVGISGIGTASFRFTPMLPGLDSATLRYSVSCLHGNVSGSISPRTFASAPSSRNSTSYYATLSGRSEAVVYRLGKLAPMINISESRHCTWSGFFGESPLPNQCGTANVWGYKTFSIYCYSVAPPAQTNTTCIYPHNTVYSTGSASQANTTYAYSFELGISTPYGTLRSELNGSAGPAPLILNAVVVGSARVVNAIGASSTSVTGFLDANGSLSVPDQSAYSAYAQAMGNMYSVLGYYNATQLYSTQIDQSIYAYNQSRAALLSSATSVSPCTVSNSLVSCTSPTPFAYVINVSVEKDLGLGNATLSYLGSVINVESG